MDKNDILSNIGYSSSAHIVRESRSKFVGHVSGVMDEAAAHEAYNKAQNDYVLLNHVLTALSTHAGTNAANLGNRFEDWPNYQEVFGSADYCECRHCKSIFGPAAYFLDLMRIANKHIKVSEEGFPLQNRRPDLFSLPLSCENTNNEIPYVSIVNNILKLYAKLHFGLGKEASDIELYEAISIGMHPQILPFHQPLNKLSVWLADCGATFADVLVSWGQHTNIAPVDMGITPIFFGLLTDFLSQDLLEKCYNGKLDVKHLQKLAVFLQITGLSRERLNEVLRQDLNDGEDGYLKRFYINQDAPETVEIVYDEKSENYLINNLNDKTLDRLYRFIKLQSLLGVPYADLDWLIKLTSKNNSGSINLYDIWEIVRFEKNTGIDFGCVCALFGKIKDYGINDFYRIFGCGRSDIEKYIEGGTLDQFLTAALNIKPDDLDIIELICGDEKNSPDAVYRHKLLADMLGLCVREYAVLLNLMLPKKQGVFTPKEIELLFEAQAKRNMTLYEMDYIINGTQSEYVQLNFNIGDFPETVEYMRKSYNADDYGSVSLNDWIYEQLSVFFDINQDKLTELFAIAMNYDGDKLAQFEEDIMNSAVSPTGLEPTVIAVSKYILMAQNNALPLLSATAKHPKTFGIADGEQGSLTARNLIDIAMFNGFISGFQDNDYKLPAFAVEYAADRGNIGYLCAVLGQSAEKIDIVYPLESRPENVVTFVEELCSRLAILTNIAAAPKSINDLIELGKFEEGKFAEFADFSDMVDIITAPAANEDFNAEVESKLRNALIPIVIEYLYSNLNLEDVTNADKLYKYFLIDVQMDDKTRISPVKEGINAVQLYLQRCRIRLEKASECEDIPESWWLWLLDYRRWEANRKVFVYPENFLLPGIRQSKTSLFKDTETAMQLSKIDEGYIEARFIKYLDSYYELTQLKICGAYEIEINGETVMYLFAKTQTEPHSFYFCHRVDSLAWGEWTKIDVPITSENITPVYAFGRLYIFWSSITYGVTTNTGDEVNSDQLQLENVKSYFLNISYSYLNLQGQWIVPQELVREELVYAEWTETSAKTRSLKNSGAAEQLGLRKPGESYSRITLLRLNPGENNERLVVAIGNFVRNTGSILDIPNNVPSMNESWEAFAAKVKRLVSVNNNSVRNGDTGYFCTGFLKIYNEEMTETPLTCPSEYVDIDGYAPVDYAFSYEPVCDGVHNAVGVSLTQSVITNTAPPPADLLFFRNNPEPAERPKLSECSFAGGIISQSMSERIFAQLEGEQIIVEGTADEKELAEYDLLTLLGAEAHSHIMKILTVLLNNIGSVYLFGHAENPNVIPVANHPGKFIFDSGDESFLVYPVYYSENEKRYCEVPFGRIDNCTIAGKYVSVATFVQMGYPKSTGARIVSALKTEGIIDKNGIAGKCDTDVLINILDPIITDVEKCPDKRKKLIRQIYTRLRNFPIITTAELADVCAAAVKALAKYNILIPWENINDTSDYFSIDTDKLRSSGDLILPNDLGGILDADESARVFKVLLSAANTVSIMYRDLTAPPEEVLDADFNQWKFAVTRLTNQTVKMLKRKLPTGIANLLGIDSQKPPSIPVMPFDRFCPADNVIQPAVLDGAQIDFEGLYAEYNWELFYHIPLMLAEVFSANGLYEESKRWFHHIFDPSKKQDAPKHYWNFFPFTQTIEETMRAMLTNAAAIRMYNNSPFNPHAIARLRIDAYAKYTVMEYINNIIKWGDSQFVQNTWESLTVAAMLYVWASDLLGPRPVNIGEAKEHEPKSFEQIEEFYEGDIPQFVIDIDKMIKEYTKHHDVYDLGENVPYNDIRAYFGVPQNTAFLQMWDIVEDRLFKLRNSLDINGAHRVTRLFEEPLDPLALAKAAAAGGAANPKALTRKGSACPYRFTYLIEQAKEITEQLVLMGRHLLNVMENSDASDLMTLVAVQEKSILGMTTNIKQGYVNELDESLKALNYAKKSAEYRRDYYKKNAEDFTSDAEEAAMSLYHLSMPTYVATGAFKVKKALSSLVPNVGSPFAFTFGGRQYVGCWGGFAEAAYYSGCSLRDLSKLSDTIGKYQRRRSGWQFQEKLADYDADNIDKEIAAAKLRKDAAERDLQIHNKLIAQKDEVLRFFSTQFAGADLYRFLRSRLKTSMWQVYQLALELALSAQEAFEYERGEKPDFLRFDYWDSEHAGLTAGEGLMASLNAMQQAYRRNNTRRLEIEKNIPLKLMHPDGISGIVDILKKNGCFKMFLPEILFARDFPGGYDRKISGVSVTIHADLPPYETIHATLSQISSCVLTKPDIAGLNYLLEGGEVIPGSVKPVIRPGGKIAVSKGREDSGCFVFDFKDERYLPFEGTGAHSAWVLEMPAISNPHLDYNSIKDIIFTVRYTCLEDSNRGNGSFYEQVCGKLNQSEE